jgi:uncharacterized membrane protein
MDPQNKQNSKNSGDVVQDAVGSRTLMAVFAYLGPLVILSYLMSKNDPFVKFHIKQGLVLFGIEIVVAILGSMVWSLWMLFNIINLGTLIFSIIGIVNAVQAKQNELPIIGRFAQSFSI